jgi:hypothetical protein
LFVRALEDRVVPATFPVTNALDSGTGSLRDAITQANAAPGADTIAFDPGVFGVARTVTLLTALPTISDDLTVSGPGAGLLMVRRDPAAAPFRVLTVDNVPTRSVAVSGVTLAGGQTAGSDVGAGVYAGSGSFTLLNAAITRNSGAGNGGGIAVGNGGALTVRSSAISGNVAGNGGGIYFGNSGSLLLENSTLSSNTADNSTFGLGGGLYFGFTATAGGMTIRNCTVVGNVAFSGGGVALWAFSGAGLIQNSTITGNVGVGATGSVSTTTATGGLLQVNGNATLTLQSTIVAGNSALGGSRQPDVSVNSVQNPPVTADHCLIGVGDSGFTLSTASAFNVMGTAAAPLDPRLGPLVNNGGPTPTCLPLAGSPAFDRGSNPANLTTDQRGSPRADGIAPDIGAVEGTSPGLPVGAAAALAPVTASGTSYPFTVTYQAAAGIAVGSLGNGNLYVVPPSGLNIPATFVGVDVATDGSPRTATYQFTPPGGVWSAAADGTYFVTLQPSQVNDTAGHSIPGALLGSFQVKVAQTFVVSTLADSGTGSLRDALTQANASLATADTITFDPALFANGPATISLFTGLPAITDSVTITGPGSGLLTVQRDPTVTGSFPSIFSSVTAGLTIAVSGMTIAGANNSGLSFSFNPHFNAGGAVTLTNVNVENNSSSTSGAGVSCLGFGSVTIDHCTISGNSSASGGGGGLVIQNGATLLLENSTVSGNTGGGIALRTAPTATIQNCTITGNVSSVSGGGLFAQDASLLLLNSTVSANSTAVDGGGVCLTSRVGIGGMVIRNSTIAGNTANDGAGIEIRQLTGTIRVQNSTITGNTATSTSAGSGYGGGGIGALPSAAGGALVLQSSIVAGNVSPVSTPNVSDVSFPDRNLVSVTADHSLVGVADGVLWSSASQGNLFGSAAAPLNPVLAPLGYNGVPTPTCPPLNGSPAIDRGNNPASLTTDQQGNPRTNGVAPDIGAVEANSSGLPVASIGPTSWVQNPGGTSYQFTVTYQAAQGINVSSLGNGDLVVSGPNGFSAAATLVGVDVPSNGSPRTATYSFTPPGGSWGSTADGAYTVALQPNQVFDAAGQAVAAGTLATFQVYVPQTLTVTTLAAAGPGSLTDAITTANAVALMADTITFDPALFASGPATINLTVALPQLTNSVTIDGPGSGLLTIGYASAAAAPVLSVGGIGIPAVNLTGMTLTRGGSGLSIGPDVVTLTDVTVVHNGVGSTGGGGIVVGAGATVIVRDSLIADNTADAGGSFSGGAGGGVFVAGGSTLVVADSTVTGNVSRAFTSNYGSNSQSGGGGIYLAAGATAVLSDSTISGNSAAVYGGGIYMAGGPGPLTVRNCTIGGNTAARGGGIALRLTASSNSPAPIVLIQNSTVAANTAISQTPVSLASQGGGMVVYLSGSSSSTSGGAAAVILQSTIVAGNVQVGGISRPDLSVNVSNGVTPALSADHSLIGVADGVTFAAGSGNNLTGTLTAPLDPDLVPMTDNGGPTRTFSLTRTSPALDAGSNPAGLTTDQRGFPRVVGAAVDIGAVERTAGIPDAVAGALPSVTSAGGTSYQFTVTYSDDAAIDVGSLGTGDVRVTGPGGFNQLATFLGVNSAGNGSPRTATYAITPPGGSWPMPAGGAYSLAIESGQVFDTAGHVVTAGPIGTFQVAIPLADTITTLADSGPGTLRQAIIDTNAAPAGGVITFDPALFNAGPAAIQLADGLPTITDSLTIIGPGSALLSIVGTSTVTKPLLSANGGGVSAVSVSSVTIENGIYGGVNDVGATLTLTDCTIANNSLLKHGGGGVSASGAAVTLRRCTISGNVVTADSVAGANGGGIAVGGPLTIDACAIVQNTVLPHAFISSPYVEFGAGGGLYVGNANGTNAVIIRNSTIANNSAPEGGGLAVPSGGLVIQNSTIIGNTAALSTTTTEPIGTLYGGGGILYLGSGPVTIQSTIVAGNTSLNGSATQADIGLAAFSTVTVTADHCLIGVADVLAFAAGSGNNLTGTAAAPLNPQLGPLGNNGGPTPTEAPLPSSPVISAGSNPAGLAFDQTGIAPRQYGPAPDIGAVESTDPGPRGLVTTFPAVTPGATTDTFTVTYAAGLPILASSVDDDDVLINGPNGFGTFATVVTPPPANATPLAVTYQFTPPGGAWDWSADGTYTVILAAGAVSDTAGNVGPATTVMGTFQAQIPHTFLVTNTADTTNTADPNYVGSLRWAVAGANALGAVAGTTIAFAPGVTGTISLTAALPTIVYGLTITGPPLVNGQPQLTVQRDPAAATAFTIFTMNGSAATPVSIGNLTISGGNGAGVGGISDVGGPLSLVNDVVTGNASRGIMSQSSSLSLTNCTVSNNVGSIGAGIYANGSSLMLTGSSVTGNSTIQYGGGIFSGTLTTIINSTIAGNSASQLAGGISCSGVVTIVGSTIANNTVGFATGRGGGIYYAYAGPINVAGLTVRDSTLTGNVAANGGGIAFVAAASQAVIQNCTITGNTATSTSTTAGQGGGGIALLTANATANVLLQSCIVAGNFAVDGRPDISAPFGSNVSVTADHCLIGAAGAGAGVALSFQTSDCLTGTAANPLNPLLAPLGNYGGPTETMPPLAGSPALNAGSNPASLTTDQRGLARVVGGAADIGAYEYAPITVSGVQVNDGSAQRSEVRSITVTFSGPVSFAGGNAAAAFQLQRVQTGDNVNLAAAVSTNGAGQTVVTLTFLPTIVNGLNDTDPLSAANGGQLSLADGRYQLTILGTAVSDAAFGWGLDGKGDGVPGGNYVSPAETTASPTGLHLYRLFADVTGDGVVDLSDLAAFRGAYNTAAGAPSYLAYLDADNNGAIDLTDLTEFRNRYNHSVY